MRMEDGALVFIAHSSNEGGPRLRPSQNETDPE